MGDDGGACVCVCACVCIRGGRLRGAVLFDPEIAHAVPAICVTTRHGAFRDTPCGTLNILAGKKKKKKRPAKATAGGGGGGNAVGATNADGDGSGAAETLAPNRKKRRLAAGAAVLVLASLEWEGVMEGKQMVVVLDVSLMSVQSRVLPG